MFWGILVVKEIKSSQTMWINSLVIARQNVPITFIHTETTLS